MAIESFDNSRRNRLSVNMGKTERWASVLGGAALAAWALRKRSKGALGLALAGAPLLFRGATGHCPVYGAMGVDRTQGRSGEGFMGGSRDSRLGAEAAGERAGGWRPSVAESRLEAQGALADTGRASASPTSWGSEGLSSSTYGSLEGRAGSTPGNETRSEDRSAGSPIGSRSGSERDPIGQRID